MSASEPRKRRHQRQWTFLAALSLSAVLSACTLNFNPGAGSTTGFAAGVPVPPIGPGGVAADDPQAASVGQKILREGGNAADAAAAMYFALAVTDPGAAGLGGGGLCVVYQKASNSATVVDFRPRVSAASGSVAVPGNVRGFAALQGRYGVLHWGQVIAPAEIMARFGWQLSRSGLQAIADQRALGGAVPNLFQGTAGQALSEGETVRWPELGQTLTAIHFGGPRTFYRGRLAQQILAASAAAGGKLSAADLADFKVRFERPLRIQYAYIAMLVPPSAGGVAFADLWRQMVKGTGLFVTKPRVDWLKFGEALAGAYGAARPWPPTLISNAGTGFAALDKFGNAVACAVTMLRPFGLARTAGNTGILLAPAPVPGEQGQFLTPLVGADINLKQGYLAASATGGMPAPAALFESLSALLPGGENLRSALALPRAIRVGPGQPLYHEINFSPPLLDVFAKQGIRATALKQTLGRVNMVYCARGLPKATKVCAVRSDPRGFGVGLNE